MAYKKKKKPRVKKPRVKKRRTVKKQRVKKSSTNIKIEGIVPLYQFKEIIDDKDMEIDNSALSTLPIQRITSVKQSRSCNLPFHNDSIYILIFLACPRTKYLYVVCTGNYGSRRLKCLVDKLIVRLIQTCDIYTITRRSPFII